MEINGIQYKGVLWPQHPSASPSRAQLHSNPLGSGLLPQLSGSPLIPSPASPVGLGASRYRWTDAKRVNHGGQSNKQTWRGQQQQSQSPQQSRPPTMHSFLQGSFPQGTFPYYGLHPIIPSINGAVLSRGVFDPALLHSAPPALRYK